MKHLHKKCKKCYKNFLCAGISCIDLKLMELSKEDRDKLKQLKKGEE